jgi:hypothetical protein
MFIILEKGLDEPPPRANIFLSKRLNWNVPAGFHGKQRRR